MITQEDSAHSAIQRADELMYRSKTEGRNRVTSG
jgi:PleD family two-component response regulator